MIDHHVWDIKKYLATRQRSPQEERMNTLLQKALGGKVSVEDMQLFFDSTVRPLDFLRKYDEELDLSDKEGKEFMNLMMDLWNATPRTELHGKTPTGTYENGEQRCKLCETKMKCPHCGVELKEELTITTEEGTETTGLSCPSCSKAFADVKIPFSHDEEDEIINGLTECIGDEVFEDIWMRRKQEMKELSKKDLAKMMFYTGIGQGFAFLSDIGVPAEMIKMWAKIAAGADIEKTWKEFEEEHYGQEGKR